MAGSEGAVASAEVVLDSRQPRKIGSLSTQGSVARAEGPEGSAPVQGSGRRAIKVDSEAPAIFFSFSS